MLWLLGGARDAAKETSTQVNKQKRSGKETKNYLDKHKQTREDRERTSERLSKVSLKIGHHEAGNAVYFSKAIAARGLGASLRHIAT